MWQIQDSLGTGEVASKGTAAGSGQGRTSPSIRDPGPEGAGQSGSDLLNEPQSPIQQLPTNFSVRTVTERGHEATQLPRSWECKVDNGLNENQQSGGVQHAGLKAGDPGG